MTCLDPPVPEAKPIIILGEDKNVIVELTNTKTAKPIDLTAATEIEAILINADDTCLHKKLSTFGITLISGPFGKFQINLSAAETALLALSPEDGYSSIRVEFTIGGKKTIANLTDVVQVINRLFPNC